MALQVNEELIIAVDVAPGETVILLTVTSPSLLIHLLKVEGGAAE